MHKAYTRPYLRNSPRVLIMAASLIQPQPAPSSCRPPATRGTIVGRRPHDTRGLSHTLGRVRATRQHQMSIQMSSKSVQKSTSTCMELHSRLSLWLTEEECLAGILWANDLCVHGEGVSTVCGGCGAREWMNCTHLRPVSRLPNSSEKATRGSTWAKETCLACPAGARHAQHRYQRPSAS